MLNGMTLHKAIYSQRAIRRFKPDPIPQSTLDEILDAAMRAPSGSNRQPWHFIIVRDPERKAIIQEWYAERGRQMARGGRPTIGWSFDEHMIDAPLLLVVCLRYWGGGSDPLVMGASVYAAVQNLMLAALALGVGTTITARIYWKRHEARELFGLPDDVDPLIVLPMGYPAEPDHFGGAKRDPAPEHTHYERWGNQTL